MAQKVEKSSHCLNCDTPLSGENYCPNCGQINNVRRPGFWSFIGESLGNFFSFDSKFFRTIYLLFRSPGSVALDYVKGKRMRYMPPVRIYFLVSVVLLFLNSINKSDDTDNSVNVSNPEVLDSLVVAENQAPDTLAQSGGLAVTFDETDAGQSLERMYIFAKSNPDMAIEAALDSLNVKDNWWNNFTYGQMKKAFNMKPEEFSRYWNSKLFWILFLFLPLFAVWLTLVYWRRDYYYLEHLHFAFYSQTALFVLLAIATIVDVIVPVRFNNLVAIIIFAVYLFMALKKFYRQSTGKTILKFFVINIGFFFISSIFLLLAILTTYISY